MAPALTPLIVQNADVLRALGAEGHETESSKAMAERLGRDPSNFAKTLKALETAGLTSDGSHRAALTASGAEALQALNRAEGGSVAGGILHAEIRPDALNPRKAFDDDSIAELADSIAAQGLLQNLVVRPADAQGAHRLVAGERRWRALRLLIEDGRWPADKPVPANVVDMDDAAHAVAALVENLQRSDLKPLEEARAIEQLMAATGQSTAEVAQAIGFTQRWVQQRLQLLKLPKAKADALEAGTLSIEDARRWLGSRPNLLEGLTPRQELVLLEVAWRIAKTSNGWWTTVPCDWRARTDSEVATLLTVRRGEAYMNDPHTTVGFARPAFDHLIALTNGDAALARAEIEPHLKRARVLAIGGSPLSPDHDPTAFRKVDELFKAKRHLTPWLNEPFEIDPEVADEVEQRASARADRERTDAEEAERRKANAIVQAAKLEAAEADAAQVLKGFQAKAWDAEALKRTFADLGAPLPWTWVDDPDATHAWNSDEGFRDANGQAVEPSELPLPLLRLLMAAMNAAANEPPLLTIADGPEPDRENDGKGEDDVAFLDDEEDADEEEFSPALRKLAGPVGADPQ